MWKSIFKTTLIAGTLDITAACIHAYLLRGTMPSRVLKFIASGAFGKEALNGGYGIMAAGLLFHFLIAFSCTAAFFLLYPRLNLLRKSILLNSLLIAVIAWSVTNLFIIPLSKITSAAFDPGRALVAVAILFICIGLPISYYCHKFYQNTTKTS